MRSRMCCTITKRSAVSILVSQVGTATVAQNEFLSDDAVTALFHGLAHNDTLSELSLGTVGFAHPTP